MSTTLEPLILDFLEWLAAEPRPEREAMDAWRTSCPRLTVWEDSMDRGFVERRRDQAARTTYVYPTVCGLAYLAAHRPALTIRWPRSDLTPWTASPSPGR